MADLLEADRDPDVPATVEVGDGLLADPVLDVTWCSTPITVSRAVLPDSALARREEQVTS